MNRQLVVAVATAALLAGCRVKAPPHADWVVLDATVMTVDAARPAATAFAISAGRFTAVGSEAEVQPLVGPATRITRLGGAFVIPGLIDAHLHFLGEGFRLVRLDLTGTASKEEVTGKVAEAVKALAPGAWLRGRGWDQNDWPETAFPTAADLDTVAPANPVVLTRIDGHAAWVNTRALAAAGVDAATRDPAGGRLLRLAGGQPSGILVDNGMDLVLDKLPPASAGEIRRAALLAAAECFAAGLTSVHEPGLKQDQIEVLEAMLAAGATLPRLYVMVAPGESFDRLVASGPRLGLHEQRLTIGAVKLYADGALGSRGAALLADYADEPGSQGLLLMTPAELERDVRRALSAHIQPAVHAIGDRANRIVLDTYARALKDLPASDRRPRIEHAQIVAAADWPRFAALGVIASMQPTHATSDMPWAEARLGRERLAGAYAWRHLLDARARLAFGSDAPVESVKPLLGIYAAVTRQDQDGRPEGGWLADQRLSVDEAVRLFTLDAAYAAFEESTKGSITVGKLADFVVLSRDLRRGEAAEILHTEVRATVLGGVEVHGHLSSDGREGK